MQRSRAHGLDQTLLQSFCTVAHAHVGGSYGMDACGFVYVWLRYAGDIKALGMCCTSTAVWLTPECDKCHRLWRFIGGKSHVPWQPFWLRCRWATTCYECFHQHLPYRTMDIVAPPLLDPLQHRRRVEHEPTYPFRTDTPGFFMNIPVWAPKPPGRSRRPVVVIRVDVQAYWTRSCRYCGNDVQCTLQHHWGSDECPVLSHLRRVGDACTRYMRQQYLEINSTGIYPWNRTTPDEPPRKRRRLG